MAFNENRIHAVGVIGNGTLDSCLIVYEPIYGNLKRVKFLKIILLENSNKS